MAAMTQDELRNQIDRLLESDHLEEAERLIEQLEQVTAEAFLERLNAAPIDDEPVTAEQRASLDRAWYVVRGGPTGATRSLG